MDRYYGAMRRLLPALLRIGADAGDDEDERLRKLLVLSVTLMVIPAALAWGAIYWVLGEPLAASVPWSYSLLGALSVAMLALTRGYRWFAIGQFAMFVILPFVLMWVLGGVISGSAVAVWAWSAPLGARIVGHRRAAQLLLVVFVIGFIASAALRPLTAGQNHLSEAAVIGFFIANVIGVAVVNFILIDAATGGREGSLSSMRGIVHRYFSPDVADAILGDPARQELGGEMADVTILFADLGGYTTYAGLRPAREVVDLLNALFATALPAILAEGGTPVQLPGDAVMAIFGAPRPQPDHARSAARAALAIQAAGSRVARDHPDWPRFRIGLNSGDALVGNIGSDEFRNFTAIGDTTNMAQRFQGLAEYGQIVIGPRTADLLGGGAKVDSLGPQLVKGKSEPVEPLILRGLTG